MNAEQEKILLCNLRTLSKLLSKSKPDLTEILCHLIPSATQADLVDESISMLLWHASSSANIKVIRKLVNKSIRQYNTLASSS